MLVELAGHGNRGLSYGLQVPDKAHAVLVLLPGSSGFADLDKSGCARKLKGNWLIRARELFHAADFATALVDAPEDHRGGDGLAGFRIAREHAEDIGKIIADIRRRTKLPVWLVGTSRGTISAANAASRLSAAAAPEGLIITSPITSGEAGRRKAWIVQTVFSLPLEDIKIPVLVVAHADDLCVRTPPSLAPSILDRVNAQREQVVILKSGAKLRGSPSAEACKGRSPHGFIGQEQEVVAGIVRFVRGSRY